MRSPDPEDAFAIWDNQNRDYCINGDSMVMTYPTEEEAQEAADSLNSAGRIVGLFSAKNAQRAAREQDAEPTAQDNSDLIGKELAIDNRHYVIESVGEISGDVSMRDVTFQNSTGFPINRLERKPAMSAGS